VAQKLKITSPKEGEYWNLENMNKIEWEAQDLSGTLEIQYSETGKWNSWKKYKEVTIKEGDATFYEPSIDGGNEGYFFIRIIAKDTNLIDKVKIKLIVENWFLITKNDNIRKAPHQSRDRIKYCKFNERYKIIKKVGDWYKIELDLYPYYGFTHKTNGVVIKETALNRGISAYDYVKRPPPTPHVQPELLGNYLNLVSGSGYIGYSSKFTYGYVLSGPLLKINHLLIGAGSISTDYRSTYRVGLGFNFFVEEDEIDYYSIIFENFMDKNENQHHIIDLGIMAIMNDPDMYLKLGYRHQFDNGKVFKEIIHSSLSGLYIQIGIYLGNMW
jgi:hypothetical protein